MLAYRAMLAARRANQKATEALMRMQNAKKVAAFYRWREWYSDLMQQVKFLKGAIRRFQNRQLSMAWERWQEWYADMVHQREMLARGIGRMMHRQLGMAFGRWHEWYLDVMEQKVPPAEPCPILHPHPDAGGRKSSRCTR
jgi:hypothetical protein